MTRNAVRDDPMRPARRLACEKSIEQEAVRQTAQPRDSLARGIGPPRSWREGKVASRREASTEAQGRAASEPREAASRGGPNQDFRSADA